MVSRRRQSNSDSAAASPDAEHRILRSSPASQEGRAIEGAAPNGTPSPISATSGLIGTIQSSGSTLAMNLPHGARTNLLARLLTLLELITTPSFAGSLALLRVGPACWRATWRRLVEISRPRSASRNCGF